MGKLLKPSEIQDQLTRHAVTAWHDAVVLRYGDPVRFVSRAAAVSELAKMVLRQGHDPAKITFSEALAGSWGMAGGPVKGIQILDHLWTNAAVRYASPAALESETGIKFVPSNLECAALRQRVNDQLLQRYGSTSLLDLIENLRARNGLFLRWNFVGLLKDVHRNAPRVELQGTYGKLHLARAGDPRIGPETYRWHLIMRSVNTQDVVAAVWGYAIRGQSDYRSLRPDGFMLHSEAVDDELAAPADAPPPTRAGATEGFTVFVSECDRNPTATPAGYGAWLVARAVQDVVQQLDSCNDVTLAVACTPAQATGLPLDLLPDAANVRLAEAQKRLTDYLTGALENYMKAIAEASTVVPIYPAEFTFHSALRSLAAHEEAQVGRAVGTIEGP